MGIPQSGRFTAWWEHDEKNNKVSIHAHQSQDERRKQIITDVDVLRTAGPFALCRIGDKIHISARSSGEINVQLILEKLEGGGHFDSAATQLESSMSEALTRLKGAVDEYFRENIS